MKSWQNWQATQAAIEEARLMLEESDQEMRELAEDELQQSTTMLETIESDIQLLLLPRDPNDDNNIFLEIRAGTGGDEAAIFAGDLFRMYQKYAEAQNWPLEILRQNL